MIYGWKARHEVASLHGNGKRQIQLHQVEILKHFVIKYEHKRKPLLLALAVRWYLHQQAREKQFVLSVKILGRYSGIRKFLVKYLNQAFLTLFSNVMLYFHFTPSFLGF